jgi:hypothetical protein
MDEGSVTRSTPHSTLAIVADNEFCAQVAPLLMCEKGSIRDAFIGEPVEEVLEMVRWALSHEQDEGFDPAKVLTSWANRRGRGAWSPKPYKPSLTKRGPNGELARMLVELLEPAPGGAGGHPRQGRGHPQQAVLKWLPTTWSCTTRSHLSCLRSTRGPTAARLTGESRRGWSSSLRQPAGECR